MLQIQILVMIRCLPWLCCPINGAYFSQSEESRNPSSSSKRLWRKPPQ
jgi:hypothetical protein